MVSPMPNQQLRVGQTVLVAWGLDRDVEGQIIELWGDPPAHVRVQLHFEEDDADAEPVVLLLTPSAVTAVAPRTRTVGQRSTG